MPDHDPIRDPEDIERKYLREAAGLAGARVLEIGCGDGRMTWLYGYEARSVTGIDPEFDELQSALLDRPQDLPAETAFLQARAQSLPFRNESFDAAIFAWSF